MDNWYGSLDARVLDLVSDYAGRELFCLEGDSLVLECLDDPGLDFEDGFQLLHSVYMVERFLARLLSTRCNFHIVFFDENREIASNASSTDIYRSRYTLAREVIFHHLVTHLQAKYPDIKVVQFSAIRSPKFQAHIQKYNVYFVMCHNGVLRSKKKDVEAMLFVIRDVMACGLDVAVVNEVEWRDVKIMTKVIQAKSFEPSEDTDDETTDEEACDGRHNMTFTGKCWVRQCLQNLQHLMEPKSGNNQAPALTLREAFTLSVLFDLVQKTPSDEVKRMVCRLLFHLACLKSLSLTERGMNAGKVSDMDPHTYFIDQFCRTSTKILQSSEWNDIPGGPDSDLHDLIDGRLFRACVFNKAYMDQEDHLRNQIEGCDDVLLKCYREISCLVSPKSYPSSTKENGKDATSESTNYDTALLPFEHKVFDHHLTSVHVTVQDSDPEPYTKAIQDNRHWHSRSLANIHPPRPIARGSEPWTKRHNPNTMNQKRVRDMEKYAASLTNAKGNVLEQLLILSPELRKTEPKGKKKDTASGNAKKIIEKKEDSRIAKAESSWTGSWKRKLKEIGKMNPSLQVEECRSYIEKCDDQKRLFLEPEVRLYLLSVLISQWQGCRSPQQVGDRMAFATEIWDQIRTLRGKVNQMTEQCYQEFQEVCQKLCVTDTPKRPARLLSRALALSPKAYSIKKEQLGSPFDFQEFQLLYCGPLMDRLTGAEPDSRVPFEPDRWQREVLDELDGGNSIFVVAPTSAGKTFISFHAISKALQEDDTGVLVYVAPTKALVNQIAAEIHARFKKSYPQNSEQSLWAIHTRDYRFNDPMKCQVLVTVPHILQIMLLAPTNARTWAPRVKCIIFDEIHSIGQADDGLVWEQLLLLAPCRIIALSATVGNPTEFADWLSCTQKSLGIDLKLIQFGQRYSDLRKHFYTPPEDFSFQGLARPKRKGLLVASAVDGLQPIHPITSVLNQQRQIPEDLSLEPRDCYLLWKCMLKHASAAFPVPEELHPKRAMPSFVQRSDVFAWEHGLKALLSTWMMNGDSPFQSVRKELESAFSPSSSTQASEQDILAVNKQVMCTSVFPLLVNLHHQGALPALLFNYERTTCEDIATAIFTQLLEAEDVYKNGATWKKKIADYGKHQKLLAKQARAAEKRKPTRQDGFAPEPSEKEYSPFDTFDPDRPLEQFSFANTHVYEWSTLEDEIQYLKRFEIKPILLDALQRGIGVHHAGLNRRYRHCVERLFRKGFLRVVVATGTLALGINMPCSTVVFCGDSVFLTALNYRQASGRAGRRGFDLLGNVIFHGIPRHKAYQLMSSRLPDLNGHFPITTSLVLRLCILLNNSDDSAYAVRAINSLLSQPRLCFGGAESKEKVLHHLRFSIEYLRRQKLLGRHGQPIDLARSVAHLYYTENSAFAFHALLRDGYLESLCQTNKTNTEQKLRTLMIVLCHLFGRISLGQRYKAILKHKTAIKSPSVVRLPDIPRSAHMIIRKHNQEILATYTAYVTAYVNQHLLDKPETTLPLTTLPAGGPGNPTLATTLTPSESENKPTHYRSPFVHLSGHTDTFTNIRDLCHTVRSGVFIEESVIPHLTIHANADDGLPPLNAYLYDFFVHGSLASLETANHISRSESWFLLRDFSLVLATIITALEAYLDPSLEERADLVGGEYSEEEGNDNDEEEEVLERVGDNHVDNTEGDSSVVSGEVLLAFRQLKAEFDAKFQAIFA